MIRLAPFAAVLAEVDQSALDALKQGFARHAHDSDPAVLLWGLVALCALALILDRLHRWSARGQEITPPDYLALAGEHLGLDRSEVRLLRTLASRSGLSYPAAMLLSPANLAYAARSVLADDGDPGLRQQVQALSHKLFDANLPPGAQG